MIRGFKPLYHLIFLTLVFSSATLCTSALFANTTKSREIEVIVYHAPPYLIETDTGVEGISLRIMEAAIKTAGYKPKFTAYPFSRSIVVCAQNPDCVWIGSLDVLVDQIPGELFQVSFIRYTTHFFYNHAKNPEYENTQYSDDFSHKSIGLLTSEYGNLESFRKKGAEIRPLSSHNALFQMLMTNRLDYAHFVSLVGYMEMANNPEFDIRTLKQPLISSEGGFILKDKALAETLQKTLQTMKKQGEIEKIIQKELGESFNTDPAEIITDTIKLSSKVF